ncbi:MAG: DNA methylase [Bacteroidetes bacterium]|nr:DNA methylase [Bacteroidota bacterium]
MKPVDKLSQLEEVIDKSQRNFYELGKALKEIRDNRLYRISLFNSFEDYVKKRWAMSKSHAYRLIEACKVMDRLSPIGDISPENESQVRPLVALTPLEQERLWRKFLESGLELTAANIRRLVSKMNKSTEQPDNQYYQTTIISKNYKDAVLAMLDQVRLAQNDGWQSTSKEAALFWNQVMKDKILSQTS